MRSHAAAVGLLAAAIVLLAPAPAPAQAAPAGELRVGSLALERCENGTRWWCGSLRRPLDPARPDGRRISVAFRWLPAFRPGERARGGGGRARIPVGRQPGRVHRHLRPLLRGRDLLLVDNRGTGDSALIDCPPRPRFAGDDAALALGHRADRRGDAGAARALRTGR